MKDLSTIYPDPIGTQMQVWLRIALLMPGYCTEKMKAEFLIQQSKKNGK